jgi:V8-like Glu-specific endopeptidase
MTPPGPFLAPIDIQSYPTTSPLIHANTYNGRPTTPPYPGQSGAPTHAHAAAHNSRHFTGQHMHSPRAHHGARVAASPPA